MPTPESRRPRETSEQKISMYAWDCVGRAEAAGQLKEYVTGVKQLANHVSRNGLGQTLAFLASKAGKDRQTQMIHTGKEYGLLYRHIETWLTGDGLDVSFHPHVPVYPTTGDDRHTAQLIHSIMTHDSRLYRRATREVMRLAVWLKLLGDAAKTADTPRRNA